MEKRKELTYSEAIEQVMLNNGYFASLKLIYKEIWKYKDKSKIKGKTPNFTIQERVQRDTRFTRIGVGVYSLTEHLDKIQKPEVPKKQMERTEFEHTRIQGMLLEIGGLEEYETYTPDRNKNFEGKSLGSICSLVTCPRFTFQDIIEQTVRFIDVIWFNERRFPARVFEVEHSTDFRSALTKFSELQDFTTDFFVVAPQKRQQKYNTEIQKAAFRPVANRCKFKTYEEVEAYYQGLLNYSRVRRLF